MSCSPTYTAVSVVPIPACSAWLCESSWIRAFALWASAASADSGSRECPTPGSNASTAIRDATSPACAPPIPSATTNSGARASIESSFSRRCLPVSVPAYCSATRSISAHLERALAVADPHAVARVQRARRLQDLLVEVRAVGRAEVLDHDRVALLEDPRVARRRERVLETDLRAVAATEHEVA